MLSIACGTLLVFALLVLSLLFDPRNNDFPTLTGKPFGWLTIWPMLALSRAFYSPHEIGGGFTTLGAILALFLSVVLYSATVFAAATMIKRRSGGRYS